jgi:hypothetical protein
MGQRDDHALDRFAVDRWTDLAGGFTSRRPRLMARLGNLETRLLKDEIEPIEIDRPIFVAGLARSGSTILLECLAEHPDTATHRYRDYPGVMMPVAWSRLTDRLLAGREVRSERAHADGIEVTPESPEAIEEMVWMAFFEDLHDPSRSGVLDETTSNPAFAAFYRDHVRKLLWLRAGRRYVSKGNYNLTRLAYLHKLFPDARFVVPVRDPLWHVASLMKQHALFCAAEERHPAALRYMQRVGHFEFGLDRRPVSTGDAAAAAEIQELWRAGREAQGLARYWAGLHGFLLEQLEGNPALRSATLILRFEDLCSAPEETLGRLLAHCRLEPTPGLIERLAGRIHFPTYYTPRFEEADRAAIEWLTADVARSFGYPTAAAGTGESPPEPTGAPAALAPGTVRQS